MKRVKSDLGMTMLQILQNLAAQVGLRLPSDEIKPSG
jgi:hypothetical protein